MDTATKVSFYGALCIGIPIIILSYRCVYILFKPKYRQFAFCRIFIASLITNSIAYALIMHALNFPGNGWFPDYYEATKDAWWQPLHSYLTRIFYLLALMLSFVLSVNRVTSLYLDEKLNEKIWRHFFFIHLPLMFAFLAGVLIDVILNRAAYVQTRDGSGMIIYMFMNYNLTRNWATYWTVTECALDLLCNVLIILKFFRIRMGTMKRTPFENSLYLVGFASFIFHTITTGVQIGIRYNFFPPGVLSYMYLISSVVYMVALLLPTVCILALTKDIRDDFKRVTTLLGRCFPARGANTKAETVVTVVPFSSSSSHRDTSIS